MVITYKASIIGSVAVFLGCSLATDPGSAIDPSGDANAGGSHSGEAGQRRLTDAGTRPPDASRRAPEASQEALFDAGRPETTADRGLGADAGERLSDAEYGQAADSRVRGAEKPDSSVETAVAVDATTFPDVDQPAPDAATDAPPIPTCSDIECGEHGICDDSDGEAICKCEPEYSGEVCDECAENYQDADGDGVCSITCVLFTSDCSENGACVIENGLAHCDCDPGHAGANCELCPETYYDHPEYGCLAPCGACQYGGFCYAGPGIRVCICDLECGRHGICRVRDDILFCECNIGYQGDVCDQCIDGYHMNPETQQCLLD